MGRYALGPDGFGHFRRSDVDAAQVCLRFQADINGIDEVTDRFFIRKVDAFFQDGPGKGPVHGTRIDIQVMDPVGQDLGDTALARSGRPINGNRQFSHGMHSFVAAAVPATKPVEKAACRL